MSAWARAAEAVAGVGGYWERGEVGVLGGCGSCVGGGGDSVEAGEGCVVGAGEEEGVEVVQVDVGWGWVGGGCIGG